MLVLTNIGTTMSVFQCSTCEIKQFEMLEMKYFTILVGVSYVWSEEVVVDRHIFEWSTYAKQIN